MMAAVSTERTHHGGLGSLDARTRRSLGREFYRGKYARSRHTELWSLCRKNAYEGGVMADPIDLITVMIVDDHEMVRRGACSYLEAHRIFLSWRRQAQVKRQSGWRRNSSPNVVLMDLVMPGMDGVEATAG